MAGLLKEITDLPSLAKSDVQVSNYLHIKRGVVDYKVTLGDVIAYHTDATNNPHNVTKNQVGLSNVVNSKQLVQANNLSDLTDVPSARAVLDVDTKAEVTAKVAAHAGLRNNPHNVTKSQVGLGSVNDYPITDSYTDASSNKYASAKACRGLYDLVSSQFKRGMIILWSGGINSIPVGWALCNGGNGTPNLQDRFVVGAGSSYAVGTQGGSSTLSHTHGITIQGHTLTASEIPYHKHEFTGDDKLGYTDANQTFHIVQQNVWDVTASRGDGRRSPRALTNAQYAGNNTYNLGGSSHAHGGYASTVTSDNKPPYYALAYIMKL